MTWTVNLTRFISRGHISSIVTITVSASSRAAAERVAKGQLPGWKVCLVVRSSESEAM